jgi:hypothetical protein
MPAASSSTNDNNNNNNRVMANLVRQAGETGLDVLLDFAAGGIFTAVVRIGIPVALRVGVALTRHARAARKKKMKKILEAWNQYTEARAEILRTESDDSVVRRVRLQDLRQECRLAYPQFAAMWPRR